MALLPFRYRLLPLIGRYSVYMLLCVVGRDTLRLSLPTPYLLQGPFP